MSVQRERYQHALLATEQETSEIEFNGSTPHIIISLTMLFELPKIKRQQYGGSDCYVATGVPRILDSTEDA